MDDFFIVHVYGHGPDAEGFQGGVMLTDPGGSALMPAFRWGELFRMVHPQLVYFNVCQIHKPGHDDGMGNDTDLATACLKAGIPNLVCLQSPLRDDRLTTIMIHFYQALSRGFPFDAAMALARACVAGYQIENTVWSIPLLYMHSDRQDRITFDDPERPHPARIL